MGRRPRPRVKSGPRRASPSTPCSSGARPTAGASPPWSWRAGTRPRPGSIPVQPTPSPCSTRCAAGSARRSCASGSAPARPGSGPRCRSCSASAAPCCAARSTCWSSATAPRRSSSTTRPTASTAPSPEEHAGDYEIQRAIYALAVAESLGAEEVEVAYVFLERPDEPVVTCLGATEMEAGRERLAATIASIGRGEFPVAPEPTRTWPLCRGCPALGRLCSGPQRLRDPAPAQEAEVG